MHATRPGAFFTFNPIKRQPRTLRRNAMNSSRPRLIQVAVVSSAILVVIAIALLILSPPNHLSQLRPFAVKEEVHFMSIGNGKVLREDALFLHDLSPDEIDKILAAEYPSSAGWEWSGMAYVASATRGPDTVTYVPTDVAMQGTSDAPPGSDMMVIEVLQLNQGQLFWERVKRRGQLVIEK